MGMKVLFAFGIILGLHCLTAFSADKVDVEGYLKNLTEGFKRDDHSVVPSLEIRVRIFADIFNAFDRKQKNLTDEESNIREAAKEFKKRTRQFDQYKKLALDYLEREFHKLVENYKVAHGKVVSHYHVGALVILTNRVLPFATKISHYGEKLNELYQDEKITTYIEKYRNESYSLLAVQKKRYEDTENMGIDNSPKFAERLEEKLSETENEAKRSEARMFWYLMKVAQLAGQSRFNDLRNPKLTRQLYEEAEKLETIDPKDLDVIMEQYEIDRALYATRKLLTVIIECQAILEGKLSPFVRQHNTIGEQQPMEYFAAGF